ncbi:MAG TPA: hypothetical protein VLL07_02965 [Pontiella sp.]|nr:hypothetical protein [Pontiella sp.]
MSDKKFLTIIMLLTVIGVSLTVAFMSMVLLDERVHSDGTTSMRGGGGAPLQSSPLLGN